MRSADWPYKYFTNTMLREQPYSRGFFGSDKDIDMERNTKKIKVLPLEQTY